MRRLPPMGALEAFVVVAQQKTLRAASEELNLSVSALSRRVQALEAHVGKPLFDRLHHELRLTGDGEWLLAAIAPAFDRLSQSLAELRDRGAHSLRIGVPPSFAAVWLMPRLQRFRDAAPDIELALDSAGAPLGRLGSSLDAVIVFAESVAGDLHAERLKPQNAFAVARPGLLAPGTTPADCIAQATVLLHGGLPQVLPAWLEAMGLPDQRPRRVEHFDSGPLLVAAAENGLGVALVLTDMVRLAPGTRALERPFGEAVPAPYSYWWVSRPGALTSQPLRRFHDWLFAQAADHPA